MLQLLNLSVDQCEFEQSVSVPRLESAEESPAECATDESHRFESVRVRFRQLNRRASGPISHPLAGSGPLRKLREHICDLSRLADAAILSSEAAVPEDRQPLTRDLQVLLQTQQQWTERLENQIWRLESQAMWQLKLETLLQQPRPTSVAIMQFAGRSDDFSALCPTLLVVGLGLRTHRVGAHGEGARIGCARPPEEVSPIRKAGSGPHHLNGPPVAGCPDRVPSPGTVPSRQLVPSADTAAPRLSVFHG